VRNLGPPEGLGAPIAFAILGARDGSFWITTTMGVAHWVNGALTAYQSERDFGKHMLRAMAEGRDGSVWFGSWFDGLLRYQGGRFRPYRRADGLAANDVRSVLVDRSGALWVTFVHGAGLQRFASGEVDGAGVTMGTADGLCGGSLVPLTEGRDGRVWLGSDEGLAVVDARGARCFGEKDGLPAGRPTAALEDERGTLWLAGLDVGLVRLRDGRFTVQPRGAGLRDGAPLGLADDRRGHLWLTAVEGPMRVPFAELDAAFDGRAGAVPAVVYDAEAGMRSAECTGWFAPGSAVARDGSLWVPTLAGVSVLPVPEDEPRSAADVIIDAALVDGRPAGTTGELRLPRGGGELDVQFTAPVLAQPGRLRFRYRLDGMDRRWVEAGPVRHARYPHLAAGRYAFHVAALDHLGRPVGRDATLAILVPPPLYQTPAFLALCAAAIAAVVLALHRRRVRLIEARHAAVHAERARIARDLHDGLGQAFASIGLLVDGCLLLPEVPERVRETLRQARQVVDLCHEDTRRSIWNIREREASPPALGTLLERIVAGFPRRAPIRLNVSGTPLPVPPLVGHELGHIAREAIANAVSHAEAARIDVEARCDDEGLALQVKDDGRGLPAAGGGGMGIGILGMKERASRIGGMLTIAPGEGGGTEVTLRVPRRELDRLMEKAS
jgi:signal transduction histidine kinase